MFCPNGTTTKLTPSAASFLTISLPSVDIDDRAVRVINQNGDSFLAWGTSASPSDIPLFVNTPQLFKVPAGETDIAVYTPNGAFTILTFGQESCKLMTAVTSIITTTPLRETNLIPLGVDPTTDQQTGSVFGKLQTLVASVLGNEMGENLSLFPMGRNSTLTRLAGYPWWSNSLPGNVFLQTNLRVMCNLNGPGFGCSIFTPFRMRWCPYGYRGCC